MVVAGTRGADMTAIDLITEAQVPKHTKIERTREGPNQYIDLIHIR